MSAYATINRVRTETRTAFCPVCRVRFIGRMWGYGTCSRAHQQAYAIDLLPLLDAIVVYGWTRRAQDALLAAREGTR